MATVKKRGTVWRVQVARNGIRKSESFPTKALADSWGARLEAEILSGQYRNVPNMPFAKLLERYRDTVTSTKRGARWETTRLNLILRDPIAEVKLPELDSTHISDWRDRRLKVVSAASVRREWTIISAACTIAINEWKWLQHHPMKTVKRPAPAKARDRRITPEEIEMISIATGYSEISKLATMTSRVGAAFRFAIETAMRAIEICTLEWPAVDLENFTAQLYRTKNGDDRCVPLSVEAVRIINQLPRVSNKVFAISSTQNLDAVFRKAKGKTPIKDLHFHDSRHEAVTRLAPTMDVLDLARAVGIRDIKQLMVYYNKSAAQMAREMRETEST